MLAEKCVLKNIGTEQEILKVAQERISFVVFIFFICLSEEFCSTLLAYSGLKNARMKRVPAWLTLASLTPGRNCYCSC